MTKIKLEINETDLYKAIRSCIDHTNGDEIAKLLTSIIGLSDHASTLFFKTYLGDVTPAVLPYGTIVKLDPKKLSFSAKVDKMREKGLLDSQGNCTAIIQKFEGFYQPTTYYALYQNVDHNDEIIEDTGFINFREILEVIEEF